MLFLLSFLFLLYSVISALGFILLPSFGEIYASSALSFVIFVVFLFGDRILLGFMRAKLNTKQNDLAYDLSNIRLKFKIPRVRLYLSPMVSGWYILDNSFAAPSIIVNQDSIKKLNREELRTMLSFACFKIKSGRARKSSIYLVLFSLVLMPLSICRFLEAHKMTYISATIKFFMVPFVQLKNSVIDVQEIQASLLEEFLTDYPMSHSINGAIFKINKIPSLKRNYLFDTCIETISLTEQESKEKLSYYLRIKRTDF
ncbi:hypothetical protein A9Q84_20430 [Halobacteriovorax marinus]|uniref:Peptidase M48 domain-containing protein n=1 Tax=Halobacteriovorax marinus TaxID=97084 RepID=A0A1Y5F6Y5_9BACT|nr:hypothetical protein A9Q84_20430 [Halobacteriovorax marinus]